MELFTEIYNCYFQIVDEICKSACSAPITEKEMLALAARFGYEESGLTIVPKLTKGSWNLLYETSEGYLSKIDNLEVLPLTALQKRWLKAILLDERIGLFLEEDQRRLLHTYLNAVEPLFTPEDFYYYDRFQDGDDFSSPEYVAHFRTLVKAIRQKQYVTIRFCSRKGAFVERTYLPCRLEYSPKNDKFRLLAIAERNNPVKYSPGKNALETCISPQNLSKENHIRQQIGTINLARIESITLTESYLEGDFDLENVLKTSYYKEPVRLLITNQRNALERAMLHFANYEKQTKKLDDEHYECLIYYNSSMETELLIEILSFSPMIKVLGPDSFLRLIKERVQKQKDILT